MGGGGKWSNKKKIPRPFSCAKHHPVAALKHFYPEAGQCFVKICLFWESAECLVSLLVRVNLSYNFSK